MPNGDERSPEQWEQIKQAFAVVGPVLERFAVTHGLAVDRYYHDMPAWDLEFRREGGGQATISVEYSAAMPEEFIVHACWTWDDITSRMRYIRRMAASLRFPWGASAEHIESLLCRALETVDHWEFGEWDSVSGPNRPPDSREREAEMARLRALPLR